MRLNVVPLALLITFLVAAIGGRSFLQYRMTGDWGIRRVKKTSSSAAKLSSLLFAVTVFLIFSPSLRYAAGMIELNLTLPIWAQLLGVCFCLGGLALSLISQIQMGKSWRIGVDESERTELITHGIYRYIRHPIYSGVMWFGLGLILLFPYWMIALGGLIGYIAIEIHVRQVEETFMLKLHGEIYEEYMKSTGRYLPSMLA